MTGVFAIIIGAAMANNAALAHLLGLDPALRARARLSDAGWLGLAVGCVLLIATTVCWLVGHYLLAPFHLDWLRILVWLLVVAALAPWPRVLLHGGARVSRRRSRAFRGCDGPQRAPVDCGDRNNRESWWALLLIGDGLVLGALASGAQGDFATVLARSLGMATGFAVVLLLFTAMRDRLDGADVPMPFRGTPILLVTAAITALAFMGFAGFGR